MLVYLHLAALGLYGLSAALALAPFAGFPVASRRSTLWVAGVGAGIHAVGVAQLSLVGTGPALSVLAWCLVLLQIGSELLLRAAAVAGFPALTVGVLLAVGYAVRYAGGMHVDPAQLVWGSFTWGVLGWTVWVRVARHWAGRRAAFASIVGFAAVVLVYVALKLAQPGTERFL